MVNVGPTSKMTASTGTVIPNLGSAPFREFYIEDVYVCVFHCKLKSNSCVHLQRVTLSVPVSFSVISRSLDFARMFVRNPAWILRSSMYPEK